MQAGTALLKVPFVGRGTELAVLRVALEDACSGHGSVVLLTGEAGIGKTRLAEKLAAEASERGVVAAWGACRQGQDAPALWPRLQILVAAAQSQPVLVILDDLHWADVPTLLLLELLASDVGRARLTVVAACRDPDQEEGAPLTRTLDRIGADRVALSGLNEVEADA
jgi:predicted ATPase